MNVLVYAGKEVLSSSLNSLLTFLQSTLSKTCSVQTITFQSLKSQPWSSNCAALILPRCRSNMPREISEIIGQYVNSGGSLLGFVSEAQCVLAPRSHIIDQSLNLVDHDIKAHISLDFSCTPTNHQPTHIHTGDNNILDATFFPPCSFVCMEKLRNVEVLARFQGSDLISGVKFSVGTGRVVLWGVEFDLPQPPLTQSQLEDKRVELLQKTLIHLGLRPSLGLNVSSHPLPQFLIFSTETAESNTILNDLAKSKILKDANDTFYFHDIADAPSLYQPPHNDIAADKSSKHIILCPGGQRPSHDLTPSFDLDTYFKTLAECRAYENCTIDPPQSWGIGEAFLYGEIVSSTQTILDRNPHLLSSLPSPLVSLAAHQLNGRGRGSNVWISPSGCLQFSILLHLSLQVVPSNKLVFVQYLLALAVVEACREDAVLGEQGHRLRIKWPNDLYIVDDTEKDRRKVGGILVNTSFTGGVVTLVIGCGLNVLNRPPIGSLSQLSLERVLSMERTAAAIFAKFERMWGVFTETQGSFDPFMALYLERWLHSDQLVTITTTVPPTQVRIWGITDHGLLRTVPERTGWSKNEFIDLQPDGNSFDLMAGLIKSKIMNVD